MSKNIVNKQSHAGLGKHIVNNESNIASDKNFSSIVMKHKTADGKLITTTNTAFVKDGNTYKGIFSKDKRLVNIFNYNGIYSDANIPKKINELVKLKGIGAVTAKKIIEKIK